MLDLKTLTDRDVIDIGTEEDYKKICELLDEAGFKWCTGERYTDKSEYHNMTRKNIKPITGCHSYDDLSKYNILTLADILQAPSNSSSFQTLFPFNLNSKI